MTNVRSKGAMGNWRFRKSKKLAPGIRLNLSRRGFGIRVGPRNVGVSVSPSASQREPRASASIPGTGISYTQSFTAAQNSPQPNPSAPFEQPPGRRKFLGIGCLPLSLIGAGLLGILFICSFLSNGLTFLEDGGSTRPVPTQRVPRTPSPVPATFTPEVLPAQSAGTTPAVAAPVDTPTAIVTVPPPALTAPPAPTVVLEPTATPPTATRSEGRAPLGATINDQANMRGGPGTEYATVGSMAQGQPVEIVGRNEAGDWYKLASGAWVAAFLVDGAPSDLPVVSAPGAAPANTMIPAEAPNAENATGSCAGGCVTEISGCAIKGNVNSEGKKIYHVLGGGSYQVTQIKIEEGDRWFCTEQEALEAGFARAGN